jgi:hypothetical protein
MRYDPNIPVSMGSVPISHTSPTPNPRRQASDTDEGPPLYGAALLMAEHVGGLTR